MILIVFAHPYPTRSRANRVLLERVRHLPGVATRSLYDLYPDFGIDTLAEQAALSTARVIVFQHPLYWYSVPGLLKHWFDKVLTHGFAYGEGTHALEGKVCQWVATTGGDEASFTPQGMHAFHFGAFVPPIEQTARFCRMRWESPLLVHGSHRISDQALDTQAERYAERLMALSAQANEEAARG